MGGSLRSDRAESVFYRLRLRQQVTFFFLLICWSFSAPCVFAEYDLPAGFVRETYTDATGEHRYTVFLPEHYSPETRWPVVLFLHGAGQKGTDGIRPLAEGLATALIADPEAPFVAVFPQCENIHGRHLTCWSATSVDSKRALQILAAVEEKYSIDSSRRTLCGWSMGGYGVLNLATATPNLWRGVLAISGGRLDESESLQALAESHVPVWLIHGELDKLVPYERSTEFVTALNAAGGNGIELKVPSVGHDVWRYAFADPRVLNWLTQPDASLARSISALEPVDPLPEVSAFYIENETHLDKIPDTVALRLGNDSLEVISRGILDVIPQSALHGKLPDIKKSFSAGDLDVNIELTDVQFSGSVSDCQLKAISGGRFETVFGLAPLKLTFGGSRLSLGEDQARTGRFMIELGHRRPIQLILELQPTVTEDGLTLIPLRQQFTIDDDNWHIEPPKEIEVSSDEFQKDHVVTGLVGGLYLRKTEIEEAIKGVVPALLDVVQNELRSRDAPRLARLLWPLPALVPVLSLAPSQVKTDPDGLSLAFNMQIRVNNDDLSAAENPISPISSRLTVDRLPQTRHLDFQLLLDSITALGKVAVEDNLAFLNVLDIQDPRFDRLVLPEVVSEIFPDLKQTEDATWDVGLQLLDPFQVRDIGQAEDADEALIQLVFPRTAFIAVHQPSGKEHRIEFSLSQSLRINIVYEQGLARFVNMTWLQDPHLEVLEHSFNNNVNSAAFRDQFLAAWSGWIKENSGGLKEIPRLRFGTAALVLESFSIQNGIVDLRFGETLEAEVEQTSTDQ